MSKTYEAIKAVFDEINGTSNEMFGRCASYHHQGRSHGCPILNRIYMDLQFGKLHLSDAREAETDPKILAEWFLEVTGPYGLACGAQVYDAPTCTKVSAYNERVRQALHADAAGRLGITKVVVKDLPPSCISCPFGHGQFGWMCAITGCASNLDYDRAPNCPLVKED